MFVNLNLSPEVVYEKGLLYENLYIFIAATFGFICGLI